MRYSLSCDANGGLTFNITMKDGKVISLLGNVTSLSDSFRSKFDTDKVNLLAYAAYLSEEFDSSEFLIEKNVLGVEYMEQHYKNADSEIWKCLEKIIDNQAN